MATLFIPKVYKALQAQIKMFTTDLKSGGIDYARHLLVKHDLNQAIGPVIMSLYKTAGIATANRTHTMINQHLAVNNKGALVTMQYKYRTFGYNERWTNEIIAYFRQFLLDKAVVPISQTTHDFILRVLEQGITEGWSVDRIVKELETSDITSNRARLIVRTETTRAANYGGMISAWNNDWEMEKTWNEVKDFRTRLSHRHGTGVGGEKIDLLERFSNGLMFPGDPDGPASEVCNCRCVLTYSPKRDINGRLIPKKQIPGAASAQVPAENGGDIIVNVLNDIPTLARTLAELAVQSLIIHVVNKITNDNLN